MFVRLEGPLVHRPLALYNHHPNSPKLTHYFQKEQADISVENALLS